MLPVATIVLLMVRAPARSYYAAFFTPRGAIQGVAAHRGRAFVVVSDLTFGRERGLTMLCDGVVPAALEATYERVYGEVTDKRERLGFGFARSTAAPAAATPAHQVVAVPLWVLAALALLPPLRLGRIALRDRRRRLHGLCAQCGYDLRAATDRCTECGTLIAPKS